MSHERFLFLVAVHAFLVKDGKVLLLQRNNTGYMDGYFSVPAGHVDGGESIAAAMVREIKEETGISINESILPAHVMHRIISQREERIDYFYVINEWEGEAKNTEPEKCSRLVWSDTDQLPLNVIPYVKFALQETLAQKLFSEFKD